MAVKKNLLMMKQPESLTAKLECITCNYRNELDVAIHSQPIDSGLVRSYFQKTSQNRCRPGIT
jgi:hypothetical protein